jgi:hypothetical protein
MVNEDEMRVWKAALPAMVERCRTWKHKQSCEYVETGRMPLTDAMGQRSLCSCGEGVFPGGFDAGNFIDWNRFKRFAMRVAVPMLFSIPTMEDVSVDLPNT